MKKKTIMQFIFVLILITVLPITALADCGPKESTGIEITGLEGKFYVTLLSTVKEYGPNSVENGDYSYGILSQAGEKAWQAFRDHGVEGCYFWGAIQECEENDEFYWGYFPPDEFKIAIYVCDYDTLLISEDTYDRYAFTSGYQLDLSGVDPSVSGMVDMPLARDYGLENEIAAFVFRLLFTVAVELLLALPLGYRKKKQLIFILIVNICTQIGLNLILAVTNYFSGPWSAIGNLLWGELLVVIAEAALYYRYLPKYGDNKHGDIAVRGVGYAIAANLLSCVLGIRTIM